MKKRFELFLIFRCLSTSSKLMNEAQSKPVEKSQNVVVNRSFVANFFSGKIESSEIFPYPNNLTSDQSETLEMIVEPFKKFFIVSVQFDVFSIPFIYTWTFHGAESNYYLLNFRRR